MKVQMPPLTETEIAVYGPIVSETCSKDIKTYRLIPKTAEELKGNLFFCFYIKTSLVFLERRRRSINDFSVVYSVGKHAILLDIDH